MQRSKSRRCSPRSARSSTVGSPASRGPPSALPEFEALRDQGRDIKNHSLAHLDLYLEAFEAKVVAPGGTVHWARDAAQARQSCSICAGRRAPARSPRARAW